MARRKNKKTEETSRIEALLKTHFPNHPRKYPPVAYRYNPASIRVRVVDDSFKGKSLSERDRMVVPLLDTLPDETQSDITILLLLTPDEMDRSLMNLEFEHPTPSRL